MHFHILTIFPDAVKGYLDTSILKRAQAKKLISTTLYNIRDFATDKHRKVDDRPFGGGPGMVMKVEPIHTAISAIKAKVSRQKAKGKKTRTILFSTRGKLFTNTEAKRLSKYDHLILICGRYEGVDERVAKHVADEEISIGNYILSGGELPALVLTDAVARQIKGVLGKSESLEEEKGSYISYTHPIAFHPDKKNLRKKWSVPKVLTSGDHKKIEEFRKKLTGGKKQL
jgi:tRNA (guanine37-N1)-methyltransferase